MSVFPTKPKFEIGESIIHTYDADLMKDGVVPARDFGVIIGVIYCDENDVYVGWSYYTCLWKTIFDYPNRLEVDYYTTVIYSTFDESDNITVIKGKEKFSVINRLTENQNKKYNEHLLNTETRTGLYDLVWNKTVKDTYYDNLIDIFDSES